MCIKKLDSCVSEYFASHSKAEAIDNTRPLSAELLMIKQYAWKAADAWMFDPFDDNALHEVRKIVALGVRCLENHGCPRRPSKCNYK